MSADPVLATKQNDVQMLNLLLAHMDYFDETLDQYGKTALMAAAQLGNSESLTALLDHFKSCTKNTDLESYLSIKTIDGFDVLALAAKWGHTGIIDILFTTECLKPHLHLFDFKTALQQAAKSGHTDAFMRIVSCEACPASITLEVGNELTDKAPATPVRNLLLSGNYQTVVNQEVIPSLPATPISTTCLMNKK